MAIKAKEPLIVIIILISLFVSQTLWATGETEEVGAAEEVEAAEVGKAEVYQLKDYERIIGRKLTFGEAPELTAEVTAGRLPPLDQRLPEEPLVVKPAEEIGQYGGTLRRLSNEGNYNNYSMDGPYEFLISYTPDMGSLYPNILEGWQASADGKRFTLDLREGLKWSDGHPFTADDIMFWYQGVALYTDLTPQPPGRLVGPDGNPGSFRKVDDYALEVTYEVPYGVFPENLVHWRPNIYLPKHFLEQFHPEYSSMSEIEKTMKEDGFDTWANLFQAKMGNHFTFWAIPDRPVLNAWIAQNGPDEPLQILTRNPYYWKVDTEGNQLPYIDKVERYMVNDYEGQVVKTIAGEIDLQSSMMWGSVKNHPIVVENMEQGNYRLQKHWWIPDNRGTIRFNFSHEDPVLKSLMNDIRFRIALSVARNRDEINQLLFEGLAIPSHPTTAYGPPLYGENLFKNHLQYDPAYANSLMDELGYTARDSEGYRLRPDGERLRLVNQVVTLWADDLEIAELDRKYWEEIGIETVVRPLPHQSWMARIVAGEYDIITYPAHKSGRPDAPLFDEAVIPGVGGMHAFTIAPQWGGWIASNGERGEQPPDDILRIEGLRNEALGDPNEENRVALTLEILKIHEDNLWIVGGLDPPTVADYFVTTNRLRNVPSYNNFNIMYEIPAQFSIKE